MFCRNSRAEMKSPSHGVPKIFVVTLVSSSGKATWKIPPITSFCNYLCEFTCKLLSRLFQPQAISEPRNKITLEEQWEGWGPFVTWWLVLYHNMRLIRAIWCLEIVLEKYGRKIYFRKYKSFIKLTSSLFKPTKDCSEMSLFEWVGTTL